MSNIDDDTIEKFKQICKGESFTGNPTFVNICFLKNNSDIIKHLLLNNTSFNALITREGNTVLVPEGFYTNGSYKIEESIRNNKRVKSVNIGVVLTDLTDVRVEMRGLKTYMIGYAMRRRARLMLGTTVNIVNKFNKDDILFHELREPFVVDMIFKYFKELF